MSWIEGFGIRDMSWSSLFVLLVIPIVVLLSVQFGYESWQDHLFTSQNHCLPAYKLKTRYPLGLDHVSATVAAARDKRVLRFFADLTSRVGCTFEQTLLGERGFGTAEPRNLEAMLSGKFSSFRLGARFKVLGPLLGDAIFTQDGESWRHSREMLRPLFSSNRVDNFLQIQQHVEALISCIPEGKVVDFQPLFFRFTLDTTTYFLFGRNINTLGTPTPLSEAFAESFRIAQDFLARRGRVGPFYWTIGGKKFRDACATVHQFIDNTVQDALTEHNSDLALDPDIKPRSNFGLLGILLQETQDPNALRDQLVNLLLAGRDTTACSLTWAMRLLVTHQNVLTKLRKEIEAAVGVGPGARHPDRVDLKKMMYLNYIVKEVLRLYPPVPVNSRSAIERTTLPVGGGPDGSSAFMVKKGEAVGYSAYVMHRRKDLYGSDADFFRPERWDPGEDNEVNLKNIGWGYLPFNGGPRVCLGQEFALAEMSYTIVRLIQSFRDFHYDPNMEVMDVGAERQEVTLVLSPTDGCCLFVRS